MDYNECDAYIPKYGCMKLFNVLVDVCRFLRIEPFLFIG